MIILLFFLFHVLLVNSISFPIDPKTCYHKELSQERRLTFDLTCAPKGCDVYFLNQPNFELYSALRTLAYGSCFKLKNQDFFFNCYFNQTNVTMSDYKINKKNYQLLIDNNNTVKIDVVFEYDSKRIFDTALFIGIFSIVLFSCIGAIILLICLLCYYRVGIILNFTLKLLQKVRHKIFGNPDEYLRQLISLEALEEAFKRVDQVEKITEADLIQYGIRSWKTRQHMIKFFEQIFFGEFCSTNSNFFPGIRCGNDLLNTFSDDHWSKFEYMIVQFRGDPEFSRKAQAMFRAVHLYEEDDGIPPIFVSHLEYKKFWNRIFKHYFGGYEKENVKVFKKKIWKTVISRKINFAYLFELNYEGLCELVGDTIGRILHEEVFNIHFDRRTDNKGPIYEGKTDDEKFQKHLKNVYLKPLQLNRKHHAYRELLMSHDLSYYRTFSIIDRMNHFTSNEIEYFINLRSRFGTVPMSQKRPSEVMKCPLCGKKH